MAAREGDGQQLGSEHEAVEEQRQRRPWLLGQRSVPIARSWLQRGWPMSLVPEEQTVQPGREAVVSSVCWRKVLVV